MMTVQLDGVSYTFVSVDDHVQEPPDLWTSRLPRRWVERAPQLRDRSDGTQTWVMDGQPIALPGHGVSEAGALMTDRVHQPRSWSEVPRAAYDPIVRLKAMDADGIDHSVLYPTLAGLAGETFARLTDPDLELACVQAYNDWLIDTWAAASPRYIPQCIVPLASADAAAQEIRRAVGRGHRGVVFPALPMALRDLPEVSDPQYQVIWRTCSELQVPICFHAGSTPTIQFPAYTGFSPALSAAFESITRPFSSALVVANYLLSQVIVPFPDLKVVFAEESLAWGTFTLETMDYLVRVDRLNLDTYPLLPSEMFKRQCAFVGGYEFARLDQGSHLPVDNMLWATSFPLRISTWPETQRFLSTALDDLSTAERRRVLAGNASQLYRISHSVRTDAALAAAAD